MATLTNGTDISNFNQVGNASWRIAERAIAADRGNGFLVTKQPYDNFKFRAEFYADEGTNKTGHSRRPPGTAEVDPGCV